MRQNIDTDGAIQQQVEMPFSVVIVIKDAPIWRTFNVFVNFSHTLPFCFSGANHGVDQNDARNRRQLSVENGGNRAGLDGRSLSLVRRPLPDSGSSYQSSPGSQDYRLSWESRMRRSVTPLRTFMATPIKNGEWVRNFDSSIGSPKLANISPLLL